MITQGYVINNQHFILTVGIKNMIIEIDIHSPGWYMAKCKINGIELFASGKSHTEALERMFDKIRWAFPSLDK